VAASYATIDDVTARYDERLVAQLTGSGRGDAIDAVKLQVALDDACNEVDDFLAARYPLPLTDVPPSLKGIVCDIAIYKLHALRPQGDTDPSRDRYKDALKRLERLAARKETLAGAPAAPSVRRSGPDPLFTDELLDRYSGRMLRETTFEGTTL
jgi:phage gp36-like protein